MTWILILSKLSDKKPDTYKTTTQKQLVYQNHPSRIATYFHMTTVDAYKPKLKGCFSAEIEYNFCLTKQTKTHL